MGQPNGRRHDRRLPDVLPGHDLTPAARPHVRSSDRARTHADPTRPAAAKSFKLRLPNALPQIFTALKISATASVVGAIIGELPSGIQSGLGIAISPSPATASRRRACGRRFRRGAPRHFLLHRDRGDRTVRRALETGSE
ncbi:MAG: hypothetical protein IPK17_14080 [Chloroflexi bacterium]|uniref:hypothetical protein n=1 Tax=Candidatus Flexifilum breve TaxID=3140694 RepID=UPI003135D9DD|nr:hypothetical protein [Chloroflexota bacterium]